MSEELTTPIFLKHVFLGAHTRKPADVHHSAPWDSDENIFHLAQ